MSFISVTSSFEATLFSFLASQSGSDADGQGIQRKAETEMERWQSIDLLQDEWRWTDVSEEGEETCHLCPQMLNLS